MIFGVQDSNCKYKYLQNTKKINTIAGTLDELENKFSNRTKDYFSPRLAQD